MRSPFVTGERRGRYKITRQVTADEIIKMATQLTKQRFRRGRALTSPKDTSDYLLLHLAHLEHEEFLILLLDNRHRIISCQRMFRGTINGASVHPREVVKTSLKYNAAAVILVHNHPSGVAEPSEADRNLTRRLKDALEVVEVRVLDHFVIGSSGEWVSFSERGLI